jgi:hypothetical protein
MLRRATWITVFLPTMGVIAAAAAILTIAHAFLDWLLNEETSK